MKIHAFRNKLLNRLVKTEKDTKNKTTDKVISPVDGAVHVKFLTFDGSTHWMRFLLQFQATPGSKNILDIIVYTLCTNDTLFSLHCDIVAVVLRRKENIECLCNH